jgi:antirestriction protein ArdC
MTKGEKTSVYEIITSRILDALDRGIVPWRKGWIGGRTGNIPRNIRGTAYRGINLWLLSMLGYESPYFLTYKQAVALGGKVTAGQKGMSVILWQPFEKDEFDEKKGKTVRKRLLTLRYYTVFNVAQTEGCKFPKKVQASLDALNAPVEGAIEFDPIAEAEAIWQGFKDRPLVHFDGGDRAYYVPSEDSIHLPKKENFLSNFKFYRTLFHEGSHSTGHRDRLNRDMANFFGTHEYGVEELTADFATAFLSSMAGLPDDIIEDTASYIGGWIEKIKADPKLVITAAGRAQKACDYILGEQGIKAENIESEQEIAA